VQSKTPGNGGTPSSPATEEVTEEPVELPRVIDGSEAPSFDTVYTPDEWAPSNYESGIQDVDVASIENEYDSRTEQVENLLVDVIGAEEYERDRHGSLLAGLNAVHELSWTEDAMYADVVTASSGAMGPALELIFEENGELQHDIMFFGATDTRTSDYIEDLPNSDYHDGNDTNMVHTDYEAFVQFITNVGGIEHTEENGAPYVNSVTNNFLFGPNDDLNMESQLDTDVLVGQEYWQELGTAVDEDTQNYLEMKKELSQYAGAISEGNALSVYKQDGQTVYEEISGEQFDEQMPFGENWSQEDLN